MNRKVVDVGLRFHLLHLLIFSTRPQDTSHLPPPLLLFPSLFTASFSSIFPACSAISIIFPSLPFYLCSAIPSCRHHLRRLYAVTSSPSPSSVRHIQLYLIADELDALGKNFLSKPSRSSLKIPLIHRADPHFLLFVHRHVDDRHPSER
ncbi:Uncharacterized protein HZ326_15081 [Fusarium oxysporum f. sp. albedinis]|nr:Uncharacterized protein HZ326_15081 [Fusarium oxysporum f. sp. albedinis]